MNNRPTGPEQEVTKEEADEDGVPQKVTEMEYQYEAEMEPVYMASHLRAFRKTVEEGIFKVCCVGGVGGDVCLPVLSFSSNNSPSILSNGIIQPSSL